MKRTDAPTDDQSRLVARGRARHGKLSHHCSHCGSGKHRSIECWMMTLPEPEPGTIERPSQNGPYTGTAPVRVLPPGITGADLENDPASRIDLSVGAVIRSNTNRRTLFRVTHVSDEVVRCRIVAGSMLGKIVDLERTAVHLGNFKRVS